MEDFETLEREYARTRVELADGRFKGSGTLDLAGGETLATIATDRWIVGAKGHNGWFNLPLTTSRGQHILLHNALELSTSMPGNHTDKYESKIFPNTVVIDSNFLTKTGSLHSIFFTFDRLVEFFHYEQIESHFIFERDQKIIAAVKSLRKSKFLRKYPRSFDFFDPAQVYIVHRVPTVFRFRVGDRTYEATRGWTTSDRFGSEVRVQSQPFLRIGFDKGVGIDEALDAVWEWRRLFSQVAMAPLELKGIGVRARSAPIGYTASLYLSNLRRPQQPKERGPFDFHSGDSPYFRWRDRTKLAGLMQSWLTKGQSRRVFRVALDRVIASMQSIADIQDVATLCSAIESLPEFDASTAISRAEVNLVARAAVKAAQDAKIELEPARIHSVIAMLRNQSLPQRLRLMLESLSQHLPADSLQGVVASAHSLRQIVSHGRPLEDPTFPRVGPTVRALAAMCALYDLTSCGAPPRFEGHALSALGMASHDAGYLRHFATPRARSK